MIGRVLPSVTLALLLPALAAAQTADLSVTKADSPDPVTPGSNVTYTVTLTNNGPDSAASAVLSDALPAGTTFVSLSAPGGWTCSTPAVGAGGTFECSLDPFPVGSAVFTLVVAVDPSVTTEITNTAAAFSATPDPEPENEVGSATTAVAVSADLSVAKTDSPDPVAAGTSLTYTLTVTNAGPNNAGNVILTDTLPAGTTFQSISGPWACSNPGVGNAGTVDCSTASFAPGSAVFTLTVLVDPGVADGTVITNTAEVLASIADPNPGNESASVDTTVTNSTVISATKTVAGPFNPGDTVTYTVVLTNTSGQSQADNPGDEFTDVLPPQLTLVSATAASGAAVATVATNTVTWNGPIAALDSVTITIQATIGSGVSAGTSVSNQGTVSYDPNGDGTNDATTVTDDPAVGGAASPTVFVVGGGSVVLEIPTLNEAGLALLALLLAFGGAVLMRRRARS